MNQEIIEAVIDNGILSFDGRILELFFSKNRGWEYQTAGYVRRFHLAVLYKLEIQTNRKGRRRLVVYVETDSLCPEVLGEFKAEQLPNIQRIIAEIERLKRKVGEVG